MKRIIVLLACFLFLVASLPGTAIQQWLDPTAVSETTATNEQKSSTEEKTEEHFLHTRTRVQTAYQPSDCCASTPVNADQLIPYKEPIKDAGSLTEPTPLYLQHSSFLI
ncbi:hypothetical protein [Flavihumibacter sp. UBA7668]|uniref:hypothetical protein n=1 Tax=Flavihumibacter sp. UBA7668 TaxID=1946542 RepID=UPI0025BE452A|nr:hypothetical protein [Flavihumibacter sp. UBA7668]